MENGYEKAKLPVSDDYIRNADHDLSWDSKEPAIASQIVSDLIPTQNCTWKPRSVFTILKSLSEKDLIHDVGYVRTGKTYSRKFAPKVSRAEYLAMQVMNELPDQELPEFLEFFQGKVG